MVSPSWHTNLTTGVKFDKTIGAGDDKTIYLISELDTQGRFPAERINEHSMEYGSEKFSKGSMGRY